MISKKEFNERMINANYMKITSDSMMHIKGTIDKISKKNYIEGQVWRKNGSNVGYCDYRKHFIFVTDKYAEKNMDKFACKEREN